MLLNTWVKVNEWVDTSLSYSENVLLSNYTLTPQPLILILGGIPYSEDLPLLSLSLDSKQLQFVTFKNIPLDSKRIFFIK